MGNEGYLVQGSFDSDRARYVALAHAPVQYARPAQLAHTQVQHPWQAPAMFQPYAAPVTRSPTIQHRPANFSPEGLASTLTAQTSPIQLPLRVRSRFELHQEGDLQQLYPQCLH